MVVIGERYDCWRELVDVVTTHRIVESSEDDQSGFFSMWGCKRWGRILEGMYGYEESFIDK